jgi:hypothetical protein
MPDSGCIKFFTLDEANALLPRVRERLVSLRETRRRIVGLQAQVDIEELTRAGSAVDALKMEALLTALDAEVLAFHGALAYFQDLGCELKDLERGLVDFYSMRGNAVVYLCWMDGEEGITWWHPLDTGMKGRAPL